MCGIAGYIATSTISPSLLKEMGQSLEHRGPDEVGLRYNETAGFVHQRLSIIDLAEGQQPMFSPDDRYWITYNGEIYNFQSLRKEYATRYDFRTNSDTEVLLAAFIIDGPACLQKLRGMFAFAVYDSVDEKLFLARDHFGQKPLFYQHADNGLIFGSEIKAIRVANQGRSALNEEALFEYLTLRIITPPRTMFAGIQKLPPSHYLIWEKGQVTVAKYWSIDYRNKISGTLDDVTSELDHRLDETVQLHMVSDVEVGAFLSGGLDSSLIVAMMSRKQKGFKTFSGEVPYKNFGEAQYAKLVAEKFGTDLYCENFTPEILNKLPTILWHLDEPTDSLSIAMYYISEIASKHVKVALGGEGGDELFAGYDRYYGISYARYLAVLPDWLRKKVIARLIDLMPGEGWYTSFTHQIRWLNYLAGYSGSEQYAKSLSYAYFSDTYHSELYTEDFMKKVSAANAEASVRQYYDCANADEVVDRMLSSDSFVRMPDHPVMILDRMAMAHSLESRAPFLDPALAEFCASIPTNYKIKARERRIVQRNLCERHLPAAITRRKKQGFSSPIPYLIRDQYETLFKRLLSNSRLVEENYLRGSLIERLVGEHLSQKRDHGNRLWLLASAELWYRMYIDNLGADQARSLLES